MSYIILVIKLLNKHEQIRVYVRTYLLQYIGIFAHVLEEQAVQVYVKRNGHL